jgi:hypothetical protein
MEALGITQMEYMFQGVPVITSGVGGQSWLIRDDQEGLHVNGPHDTKGAAQAIVKLLDDTSKWSKLSVNAKARALPFAFSNLIEKLDLTLNRELEKESGLVELPAEVTSTLAEPEIVVGAWSHSNQKVVATNKRAFIQQGRFSRKTLEVPYSSIQSIEHIRRYPLRTLLGGLILSALLFVQHYIYRLASTPVTSAVADLFDFLLPNSITMVQRILSLIFLAPVSVALILFAFGARKGFALHGASLQPVYLPFPFSEAIGHIREIQETTQEEREDHKVRKANANRGL